ncbi:poils au dos [Carabus blaptoides fortunei]
MAKKLNSNDKNKICRICLKNEKFTISIFCDYAKELNVHSRIETYLQVKIDRSDSLPKYICYDCYSNLEFVEKIINKARNSQTTLGTKEESGDSLFDDASFHTPPNVTTKSIAKSLMKKKLDDSKFRSMAKKARSVNKLQEGSFTREFKRFKNSLLDFKNNITIPKTETDEKIVDKINTKIIPKSEDVNFQNRKTLLTDYYKQKCSLLRNNN